MRSHGLARCWRQRNWYAEPSGLGKIANLNAADIGAYFGFGALLMLIGSIFELILGNTFPAVVFGSFGAFWFAYGGELVPSFGATTGYTTTGGARSPSYAASLAFLLLWVNALRSHMNEC